MASEICPYCRVLRMIRITTTQKANNCGEKTKKVITQTYHCASCNSFIRSVDIDSPEE